MKLSSIGQINVHKTQGPSKVGHETDAVHGQYSRYETRGGRGHREWSWRHSAIAPYARPDHSGRVNKSYKNRTLVVTKTTEANQHQNQVEVASIKPPVTVVNDNENGGAKSVPAPSGWVSKRDRHMQLISSKIYDKEFEVRKKAIDQTQRRKAFLKRQKERDQANQYLRSLNDHSSTTLSAPRTDYRVVLGGLSFTVMSGGSKLSRDPGKSNDIACKELAENRR